jgi:hypothetical protein
MAECLERSRSYSRKSVAIVVIGIVWLSGCGRTHVTITRPNWALYIRCEGTRFDARRLLGKSLHTVEAQIESKAKTEYESCVVRAVEIDGHEVALTEEALSNRIDVSVRDGEIVRIAGFH